MGHKIDTPKDFAALVKHPVRARFADLDEEDYEALKRRIDQHGLRRRITLVGGKVLDGWARHRACIELGITPLYRVKASLPDAKLEEYLYDKNLARGEAAKGLKVAEWIKLHPDQLRRLPNPKERSLQKETGVGSRTCAKAYMLFRKFADLFAEVVDRKVTLQVAYLRALARKRETAHAAHVQQALPQGKWPVIMADPPWRLAQELENEHYMLMKLAKIKALPVASVAMDNCVLFLWCPAGWVAHAIDTAEAWGFRYVTSVIWLKERKGYLGQWLHLTHEHLLICTRGTPPTPKKGYGQRGPSVITERARKNSVKPEAGYDLVELLRPQHGARDILYLFGRKEYQDLKNHDRSRWVWWGDPDKHLATAKAATPRS